VAAAHQEVAGRRRLEDARHDVLGQRRAQVRVVEGAEQLGLRGRRVVDLRGLDLQVGLAEAAAVDELVVCGVLAVRFEVERGAV